MGKGSFFFSPLVFEENNNKTPKKLPKLCQLSVASVAAHIQREMSPNSELVFSLLRGLPFPTWKEGGTNTQEYGARRGPWEGEITERENFSLGIANTLFRREDPFGGFPCISLAKAGLLIYFVSVAKPPTGRSCGAGRGGGGGYVTSPRALGNSFGVE